MKNLRKKMNKKGFTLAEMLIVVAIIAVLVAVSIPVFTSKLEKAREATDIANMRAAKAAAVTAYLSEDTLIMKADGSGVKEDTTYYYNASTGVLVSSKPDVGYGQGTDADGGLGGSNNNVGYDGDNHKGEIITVEIDDNGTVTLDWDTPAQNQNP